jgi:hypothetical protein
MSGEANQNAGESNTAEKPGSALAAGEAETANGGATSTETPAAKAAGDGKGAGTEGATGEKPAEAFDFTKWEPKLEKGVSIPKETLDGYRGLFKELGLKGEGAQKLVDAWAKNAKADVEAQLKQVEDNRAKGWASLKSDKELGGTNFEPSLKHAQRAVREFGGKALADRLFDLGLDNDPVLVTAFVKIGKRLGEDSVGETAAKPGADKPETFQDRVARTYSNTKES